MEKRKPTYDLDAFKAAFHTPGSLKLTGAALLGARQLGMGIEGVAGVIRTMERQDFYKSMTSYEDHTVWQDVYHVPWQDLTIYLKFTADRITSFRILSFKEK